MMSRSSAHRSIARNATYLVGARLLARGLRVIYLIALARLLGPELFALLSYAQFWQLLFFSLVVFGTGRLLSRDIGRDPTGFSAVLTTSLSLRIGLGLVVAPVTALAGWWLAPDPAARGLLVAFSLVLIARGLASWTQQVFTAYEASHLTLRQEALWRSAETVLGLAALAAGAGLMGIAMVHALSWALQAATGLLLVHRKLHPVTLGWDRARLRVLLHDGLSAMLVAFALGLIQNGSLLVYLKLCPVNTDGGQLAVLLQALSLLLLVPKGIAVSTLPVLGRQVAAGSGDAGRTVARLLMITLAIAAVLALSGMAVAPTLTELLLGADYAQAGTWLGPSLWLLLPFAAGQLLTQLLFAHGDIWANAARAWAAAAATLLTLWPLGTLFGAPGVLMAMGLGLCVWAASLFSLVARRGHIRFRREQRPLRRA